MRAHPLAHARRQAGYERQLALALSAQSRATHRRARVQDALRRWQGQWRELVSARTRQHTVCPQRAICYARPPACTCQKASGLRAPAGARGERAFPRHAQAGAGARCYAPMQQEEKGETEGEGEEPVETVADGERKKDR
jgi:hypothetical protein